jgi:hypothetical protein
MVSRDVGSSGCLCGAIFGGVGFAVVGAEGLELDGRFWVLCERRGVADPESMILDAERKILMSYDMRQPDALNM